MLLPEKFLIMTPRNFGALMAGTPYKNIGNHWMGLVLMVPKWLCSLLLVSPITPNLSSAKSLWWVANQSNLPPCLTVSSGCTALLTTWGLGSEGFGHWLQLMCCTYLLMKSEYLCKANM